MIFLKRRAFMTFKFNYETSKGIKQVILTNCGQAPFKRFSILGNSHQDSTTGKQLFKLTDNYLHAYFYHGENKEIVPYSSNAVVYLPCEPNTTYTIHGRKNINNDMTRKNRVGLTSELPAFNVKITKTAETTLDKPLTITTEEDTKYLVIMAITDGEIGKLNFDKVLENNTSKLMVEVGDKASPYEPYTGGKPSPRPEYPQEIKNSGKKNEEKQKYEVDVKVTGKNLFDVNYFTKNENYQNKDGDATHWKYATLKVEPNTTYTVSKSLVSKVNGGINNEFNFAGALFFYNDTKSVKITSKDNGILYVMLYNRNEDANILKEMDIQVELGEKLTEYQPYQEQTLTITSDRPITKWDRLVEQGGQIGWLYAGVVIDRFDGQSNKISIANKQGNVQNFSIRFENVANGNGNSDIFVDKYRAVQLSYTKAEYGICCNWNDGVKYFSAPNENVATVDEFKAWLIENPLKIAYETTNPEFVPLPQSEQDAVRNLKTYYPTTVIMVDGGDVDAGIEVEYAVKNKEKI